MESKEKEKSDNIRKSKYHPKAHTQWHDSLVKKWQELNDVESMDPYQKSAVEAGVTFDQKVLFLSCVMFADVGPVVQVIFLVAIILFYLTDTIMNTHCKIRRKLIFSDSLNWNSWILRHGGLADIILAWHFVLLFTIQTVIEVLVFCDGYVYFVNLMTKERLMEDGVCIFYSMKIWKAFLLVPLWFHAGMLITGTAKQLKTEREVMSSVGNWCLRAEVLGLLLLGPELWNGEKSFTLLLDAYRRMDLATVLESLPVALIILNQYWVDIPYTFGKTKQTKLNYSSECRHYPQKVELLIVCIFIGLIQPVYANLHMFSTLENKCEPIWNCIPLMVPRIIMFIIRIIHVIVSTHISFYLSCITLVRLSKAGLTIKVFSVRNPFNGAPVFAVLFIGFLAGTLGYIFPLESILQLQALNIIFSRIVLSLSILLRKLYIKSAKILIDNQLTDKVSLELTVGKLDDLNTSISIYFVVCVISVLVFAVASEVCFNGLLKLALFPVGMALVLLAFILVALIYILSQHIRRLSNTSRLSFDWPSVVCVILFAANCMMCAGCFVASAVAYVLLLVIGLLLYYFKGKKFKKSKTQVNKKK